MAEIPAEIQQFLIKSAQKASRSRNPSVSIQDWTVNIHRIEEGGNGDFHMTTSRVRLQSVGKSPNVFRRDGQDNGLIYIQTPSKSASPRSATPGFGFVITHSTVELPCKTAHRPNGRNHCEDGESADADEEESPKCYSDFDNYDAYVQKYEAEEGYSENGWLRHPEDSQPTSPLNRNLDAEDWYDSYDDWDIEFWADEGASADFNSDCDYWGDNDNNDDDYECWDRDFEEIDLEVDEDEE